MLPSFNLGSLNITMNANSPHIIEDTSVRMFDNDSVQPSVDHPVQVSAKNKPPSKEPNVSPLNGDASTDSKVSKPPPTTKAKSPTKFGKANPVRDIILLVSLLGLLMLLSPSPDEPKKKTEEEYEADNLSLTGLTAMLQNLAKEAAGLRRKDQCSLFLHTGSIPNTGLGYFAGRNYSIGEVILEDYQTLPEVVNELDDIGGTSTTRNNNIYYVTPSALVLKHHPILYNIQGVLYYTNEMDVAPKRQLRASKTIQEGDELFVEYNPILHDNAIFNHIPKIAHYNRTKEIVADALRSVPDQTTRNGRVICRMLPVMRFVKQVVARYDPMVATLLPESLTRANHYRKLHPSVATLRNSTLLQLQQMGVCMDDIVPPLPDQDDNPNDTTVVALAQRHFRRGSVVTTLPLYMMKAAAAALSSSSSDQTCGLEQDCTPVGSMPHNNNCFINENMTAILFCPLGPNIIRYEQSGEEHLMNDNLSLVNVEYQWSKHRGVTEHFVMRDSFKYSTSITAWDVIALRDIEIGEKLLVKGMPQGIPDHIMSLHGEIQ